MRRSLHSAAAVLTMSLVLPAAAADYLIDPDLRPAYPERWEDAADDSIRFEYGAAYWYSWGGQNAGFSSPMGPVNLSVNDQTHIGELHGKIDDLWSQTYLAGRAGLGLGTSGTYEISPAGSGNIGRNSRIGYVGADFGWLPLGELKDGIAAGGFVGYHYWKDAPDIGTGQIATGFDGSGTPTSFGEARDDFDMQALRLGVKATAEFDLFDFQAEAAWLPYAHVTGALGGSAPNGFGGPIYENAQTTLSGRGQGVMLEGMVGFHPTENLVMRIGGRAWYLEGNLDAVFNATAGGVPQPAMTLPSTYASLFRYGLRAELTGKF
jgi:hypothetical protein